MVTSSSSEYKGYQSDDPLAPYYRKPEQPKTLGTINEDGYWTMPMSEEFKRQIDKDFSPDTLLEERGHTHGEYKDGAAIIQATKTLWRAHPGWADLNNCQKETLDMAATKIGRILAGDQNCIDHYADTAGYMTLIVNMLRK